MINLKITSTVSSFLNEKTLEGFHPVRGMVLKRVLPVEELTPTDLDMITHPDTKTKEWIPRPALVDMERVLRLATGHPHTVYGESLVSPKLIHWTVGEAQLLVGFGSVLVPQRASAMNVVMLLGNQEAHRLIQQTAVELRAMISPGASRTTATMPRRQTQQSLRVDQGRTGDPLQLTGGRVREQIQVGGRELFDRQRAFQDHPADGVEPFEGLFVEEGTDGGGDFEVSHSKYGAPPRPHSGQGALHRSQKQKRAGANRLRRRLQPLI